jgi:hypothetical protein
LALIVEDIIRDDNIEETPDRMVEVIFRTPGSSYGDMGYASAYAFRDKALAREYRSRYQWDDAKVMDGVYVFGL